MSARDPRAIARLLLVDKPAQLTSFDVVREVRRLSGLRRVGHAGTLDPFATGLLVVGLGAATRLLQPLAAGEKSYRAELRFGFETDSADLTGTVTHRAEIELEEAPLRAALEALTGSLEQVPPRHSAIKVDGRRSYERARRGEEFELPARRVTVHAIELLALRPPNVELMIRCSGGTYIRSLARDLGRALGGAAHLSALCRESVGPFRRESALPLAELATRWPVCDPTLDPAGLVRDWPAIELDPEQVRRVRQGAQPEPGWWEHCEWTSIPDRVALLDADRHLVAIAQRDGDRGLRLQAVLPECA